jgi:hypothetical protein
MGVMNESELLLRMQAIQQGPAPADGPVLRVEGDCLRIAFGEASIEMHRDGRIVLRGTHIASYSSGANKLRGTSIELN